MGIGVRGMVCSPHEHASFVGASVLARGGNAVDAAIAASAMLSVVYPQMGGLGGDGFALVYWAGTREVVALNASGPLPVRARRWQPGNRTVDSATIPGMVDAWRVAHATYGSVPVHQLLAPAIEAADGGTPGYPGLCRSLRRLGPAVRDPGMLALFYPRGRPPAVGQAIRQAHLARTLVRLAREGLRDFYEGRIGKQLVSSVNGMGGAWTTAHLASYAAQLCRPVAFETGGLTFYQCPPNSQGTAFLVCLNILKDSTRLVPERHDEQASRSILEAVRTALHVRNRVLADPDFVSPSVERLLDPRVGPGLALCVARQGAQSTVPSSGGTACLCVVDRCGNAVSWMQSLFEDFGCCRMAEGGIVLNNRGDCFCVEPDRPNSPVAGKRPLHTLMPGLICKEERPWALMGTMGGQAQLSIQLQVCLGLLRGDSPARAVGRPRWTLASTPRGFEFCFEPGVQHAVVRTAREMGVACRPLPRLSDEAGHCQLIARGPHEEYWGAADPRADGSAVGL